jgi:hypothetical protein
MTSGGHSSHPNGANGGRGADIWYLNLDLHICNFSVMLPTARAFYSNPSDAAVASPALLKHF